MSLVLDLVLNHVARGARVGPARAGRRGGLPRLLPRLRRPEPSRRLRADAAGGLPRLRPRQLHLVRRARRLGLDDVQRVAVGRQLVQPGRARRVRVDHPRPRQPRGRRLPSRRHRLHVEADGHRLPGRARGPRHHPGAPCGDPDRLPGGGVQGGGHRRPGQAARLPRRRTLHGQGQRPRLPQQPHGPGLVDARRAGRPARGPRPRPAAAQALDVDVGDLCALSRRHRLGHLRRGRRRRGRDRPRPPQLPRPLVRGRLPGLPGARAGVPVQPGHRRPADERHGGEPGRPRGGVHPRGGRPRRRGAPPRPRDRHGLGRHPGHLERRRAGAAQRPALGQRARPRGRQQVGPPPPAGLGPGRLPTRPVDRPGSGVRATSSPSAGPARRSPTCMPPSGPLSVPSTTPGSSSPSATTRSAGSSGSTTSRRTGGCGRAGGPTSSASPTPWTR